MPVNLEQCDSRQHLSPAEILSLDGQVLAIGLLDVENPQGYFQASEMVSQASIESATEVQAEVNGQRFRLIRWRRCQEAGADHFHFAVPH